MKPFQGLASALRSQGGLALNPVTQSVLAQKLLQGSMQSPQGLVSPSGVANKILIGMLAASQARSAGEQQNQNRKLAEQLLGGVRQGANIQMDDVMGGQFQTTSINPQLSGMEQNRAAIANLLSQNPESLQGLAMSSIPQAPKPDIKEGVEGEFIDFANPSKPVVLRQAPSKPESTDDIREYNAAVAQGYKGSLEQWIKGQREAGATRVTTDIGDKRMPDLVLKAAIDSSAKADTMRSQVTELSVFRDLASQTETGGTVPITLPIKQIMKDIGIDVGENVPFQEAFQAQEAQMALRLRNPDSGFGLTGNTSNRDIQFLTNAVASLGKTPEGNQAILTIMIAKQRREAELADLKAAYIWDTGSLKDWEKKRDEYVQANPFFTEQESQQLLSLKGSALSRTALTNPSELTDEQLRELAGGQ